MTPPKPLSFWPGIALIAVVLPAVFYVRFGRVDAFAMGFTAFLLLITMAIQFIPALNKKYGTEQEKIKVSRGPFDWLGPVWLLCIPFAPFLLWMMDSLTIVTIDNWKIILGTKAGLCVLLPCVSVLPLLRYVRGKATPYALLILALGTGFPVSVGWHSMRDFLQGPQQETVSVVSASAIHLSIKYRDVTTSILEVKLSDGRTLEANTLIGTVAPGPADITLLPQTGVMLAVH
jgi:hypothetical protein